MLGLPPCSGERCVSLKLLYLHVKIKGSYAAVSILNWYRFQNANCERKGGREASSALGSAYLDLIIIFTSSVDTSNILDLLEKYNLTFFY